MTTIYIAIEKSVERFDKYKVLWEKRGITGIWAATMTEGIKAAISLEKSNTQELFFVSIVANEMPDFIEKLSILSEETTAPILVATENYTEKEHHEALNNGADFYAHFCETTEENIEGVIAAINSIERRKKQKSLSDILSCGRILISLSQRKAFVNDAKIKLTGLEFYLLHYFMSNLDRALSYEEIYLQVWKEKYSESNIQAIKSAIKKLRKKISSDKDENRVIENVRGFGYKMPS